jgi:hypothetical protein
LTPRSYCIIHQMEEASIWRAGISISDIRSFTTSTPMTETEIFETLLFSLTLTRLIARENFSTDCTCLKFSGKYMNVCIVFCS